MLTEKLHSVRSLGKWATSVQAGRSARLKARRKKSSSKGKTSLPIDDSASSHRESAVVHSVQMDHFSFGDKSKMYDYDSAVEKTVETLTGSGNDAPRRRQENETGFAGGILSR